MERRRGNESPLKTNSLRIAKIKLMRAVRLAPKKVAAVGACIKLTYYKAQEAAKVQEGVWNYMRAILGQLSKGTISFHTYTRVRTREMAIKNTERKRDRERR